MITYLLYLFLFWILYKIYFYNLIFFLDNLSTLLGYIYLKVHSKRSRIIESNLNRIFPNITKKKVQEIKTKSTKLFFLNILMCLHQRFLIKNDFLVHNFENPKINKEKLQNSIFVMAHYGIFWHPIIVKKLFGPVSFIFKDFSSFLKNIIIPKKKFIDFDCIPYSHNEVSNILSQKKKTNIYIVSDHITKNGTLVKFLNHEVKLYNSPITLHKLTKLPIYIYFCRYNFEKTKMIQEIIPLENKQRENVATLVQKIADIFTEEIIKNPEQYLWSQLKLP